MRIAYFTAGTVGAGHLVRGLAVFRGLKRAGFGGEFRAFGPARPYPQAHRMLDWETVEVQTDLALRSRHLAQTSELARRLAAFAPDLLLVDMFWAPLYWVLPAFSCEAWLLMRLCPPQWVQGPPGMPFDPGRFARLVAIEPMPPRGCREELAPIVVCNPDECRPPGALREHLGVPQDQPLTVVPHAGERGEAEQLAEVAGPGAYVLDLFEPEALFPAAEWLGGADRGVRIVASAGYNAFWEAHWLGYAERAEWVPFARSIDDQALRIELSRGSVPVENGADRLARWILH